MIPDLETQNKKKNSSLSHPLVKHWESSVNALLMAAEQEPVICLKDQDSAERRKRKLGSEVRERDDASTSTKKAKTTSTLPNNVVTVVDDD